LADTAPRNSPENNHDGWLLRVVWSPDNSAIHEVVRLSEPSHRVDRAHSRGAPVFVVNDPAISKGCVVLQPSANGVELIDSGSRNPVRVSQAATRRQQLRPNDVVRVGDTVLVLEADHPARHVTVEAPEGSDCVDRLRSDLFLVQSTEAHRILAEAMLMAGDHGMLAVRADVVGDALALAHWLAGGPETPVLYTSGDPATVAKQVANALPTSVIALQIVSPPGESTLPVLDAIRARQRTGSTASVLHILPLAASRNGTTESHRDASFAYDYEIELTPLCQRRADIGRAFVDTARTEASAVALNAGFVERAVAWSWSGGIQDLRTQLARLRRVLRAGRAPESIRWPFDVAAPRASVPMNFAGVRAMTPDAFAEIFEAHGGNLAHVATALGVSRTWLYKALPDIGVDIHGLRARLSDGDSTGHRTKAV
jgi:hypothetical protein